MSTKRRPRSLQATVAADLTEADELFRRTGDPVVAMEAVRIAIMLKLPLPAAIGRWLDAGLGQYLGKGTDTLDRALGLVVLPGEDSARNRAIEQNRWVAPLADVHLLAALGATIPQAAHMVAANRGVMKTTLERKYRDSNRQAARKRLADELRTLHYTEVEQLLARYPDKDVDVESGLAKARIRKRYAR